MEKIKTESFNRYYLLLGLLLLFSNESKSEVVSNDFKFSNKVPFDSYLSSYAKYLPLKSSKIYRSLASDDYALSDNTSRPEYRLIQQRNVNYGILRFTSTESGYEDQIKLRLNKNIPKEIKIEFAYPYLLCSQAVVDLNDCPSFYSMLTTDNIVVDLTSLQSSEKLNRFLETKDYFFSIKILKKIPHYKDYQVLMGESDESPKLKLVQTNFISQLLSSDFKLEIDND